MRSKGFSIIEIIFILVIISIILVVAVPKMKNIFETSYKTQIKSTISFIREGIIKEKNRLLLANSMETLNSLDDGDEKLFSKVLQTPILESTTQKSGSWVRVGINSYKVFTGDTESIIFIYNPDSYSFDCDYVDELCKELTH